MRVVLDTGVLFAAFRLESGFCTDLVRHCILRHVIVTTDFILEELRRHLVRKGNITSAKVAEVIDVLREIAIVVTPAIVPPDACRDKDDLPILGTAIAANAEVLVTGDKDLLTLHRFRDVPILSPREFHNQYIAGRSWPKPGSALASDRPRFLFA